MPARMMAAKARMTPGPVMWMVTIRRDRSCSRAFLPVTTRGLGPQRPPDDLGNGPILRARHRLKPLAQLVVEPKAIRFKF
jgi:hypothetical protein